MLPVDLSLPKLEQVAPTGYGLWPVRGNNSVDCSDPIELPNRGGVGDLVEVDRIPTEVEDRHIDQRTVDVVVDHTLHESDRIDLEVDHNDPVADHTAREADRIHAVVGHIESVEGRGLDRWCGLRCRRTRQLNMILH